MTARLLVVDDVPANGRLLQASLAAAYYDVKFVTNGSAVEAVAREWRPDVILLDVMMPEMNGYDVCRALKADPETMDIPVILVTALNEQSERRIGLGVGADEFLVKPVETEILLARLRSIIRLKQLRDEWRARNAAVHSLGFARKPVAETHGAALIVEDLAARAEWMRATLAQGGILTETVDSEAAALAACERRGFDLVLISLSLIGQDPLMLLAKLKAAPASRETPILLITEPGRQELLIRGLDLGASDSVASPLDETEFLLRAKSQIRRKQYQDRLREDVESALELAAIDPLTNLFNRRYLMNFLDRICGAPEAPPCAVLMIDIDHFKQINDRFGHPIGDQVLVTMGEIIRAHVRQTDVVARYGGEEFAVVLCDVVDEAQAERVAEKLKTTIEQTPFEPDFKASISLGVAIRRGAVAASALLDAADKALYEAKRNGRNRFVCYRGDYSEYERRKRVE